MADLCSQHGIALCIYLKAIHGAKAKNDPVDAGKLAVLLRGGVIPMAYVYPPAMRPARDLLRRRLHFSRKRAELFCHIQNTFHQYKPTKPTGDLNSAKHRSQLATCFTDSVVRAMIEVDLHLCNVYDALIRELEKKIEQQARVADPTALLVLRTTPGVGKILALTILYEIHTIDCFTRVQDFSSYCRPVKPEHSSAGSAWAAAAARSAMPI